MKKFFSIVLATLILAACASKQPNSQQDGTLQDDGDAMLDPESPAVKKDATSRPQVQKSESTASSVLDEAIRSQNDEAIYRAATGALSQNAKDLKAQNALGIYHLRKGHLLAAQYFFSRASAQSPNSSELHNNLGLVSLALKEKKDAINYFRKSFELNNSNPVAAANLGALYVEEKDYVKALQALDIAAKKGPRDYRVLNNLGIALAANGKFSLAKDQYQEALRVNSSGREAMYNLAVLQVEHLKNYQEGLDLINKVRFLGPPDSARSKINILESKAKAGLK